MNLTPKNVHKFACFAMFAGAIIAANGALAKETEDSLMQRAQSQFDPIPAEPPSVEGIKLTPARVKLGKWLYFDPRLSKSRRISCNSCHQLSLTGIDLQETSIGHGWQRGPRNAPTVLNAVFNVAQFWDGRAKNLHEQAKGPITTDVEMNDTPERVVKTLESMPAYVKLFQQAFPKKTDFLTFDTVAEAIASFETTLTTPGAPFDQFLKGDATALTELEKKGLDLFTSKGCSSCHYGINVGGDTFRKFGVVTKPSPKVRPVDDKGRFEITQDPGDKYVFKVPSLRNVARTSPYFHSGQVWDLHKAVSIMGEVQLGIDLNGQQIAAIVAFLHTLTGKQPHVELPVLPARTKETPH